MQKRTFLSNVQLIRHATKGKSISKEIGTRGTSCEDYVLEKKVQKSLNKLEDINKRLDIGEKRFKRCVDLIKKSLNKEDLILFLETKFTSSTQLYKFFIQFQ